MIELVDPKEGRHPRGGMKMYGMNKETKGVGEDPGIPSGCGAYPMQVGVRILRHVVVKGNVHPLNVHASAKQVGSHKNSSLKIFKLLIPRKPL